MATRGGKAKAPAKSTAVMAGAPKTAPRIRGSTAKAGAAKVGTDQRSAGRSTITPINNSGRIIGTSVIKEGTGYRPPVPIANVPNSLPPERVMLDAISRVPVADLTSVEFVPIDPVKFIQMSIPITKPSTSTEAGAVNDSRMGVNLSTQNGTCGTCMISSINRNKCAGHPGHIVLPRRGINGFGHYYNPTQVSRIVQVLHSICLGCGMLRITPVDPRYERIMSLPPDKRLAAFATELKQLVCMNKPCEGSKHIFDASAARSVYTISEGGTTHNPEQVYNWINQISDEVALQLGFRPGTHPRYLFLSVVPVVPPCQRPPSISASGATEDHPTTKAYVNLLQQILRREALTNNGQMGSVHSSRPMTIDSCDADIDMILFKLFVRNTSGNEERKSEQASLSTKLTGKKGAFRMNTRGTNVGNSIRLVIVPDNTLRLHQVGISQENAETLVVERPITAANRESEQVEVQQGRYRYIRRGAQRLRPRGGVPHQLQIGDVLFTSARTGDRGLINRPPTLSDNNLRYMEIVVIENGTNALHYPIADAHPVHGDYDGDQIILMVFSGTTAAQLLENLDSRKCLIDRATSQTVVAGVQDVLIAWYLASHDFSPEIEKIRSNLNQRRADLDEEDAAARTALSKDEARLANLIEYVNGIDRVLTEQYDDIILDVFGSSSAVDKVTRRRGWKELRIGQKLFSTLLPDMYNYESNGVQIQYGLLKRGSLTAAHIGVKKDTIIADLYNVYEWETAADFVDGLYDLGYAIISRIGISVNMEECYVHDVTQVRQAQQTLAMLEQGFRQLAPPSDPAFQGTYEDAQIKLMGQVSNLKTIPDVQYMSKAIITRSGAKGLSDSTVIGGRLNFGRPVDPGIYRTGATEPELVDYAVLSTYAAGITGAQSYLDAASTRTDMARMATATPDVGELERRITRFAESMQLVFNAVVMFGFIVSYYGPPTSTALTYLRDDTLFFCNPQREADHIADQLGIQRELGTPQVVSQQLDILEQDGDLKDQFESTFADTDSSNYSDN